MFRVATILLLISSWVVGDSSRCSLVEPDSPDCAFRGRQPPHDNKYFGLSQFVQTVKDCALLCSRRIVSQRLNQGPMNSNGLDTYCAGFEYEPSEKLCTLMGVEPGNGTIKPDPNSRYTYYSSTCFDCGDICDQPYGTELFDNTGFEQKLLGPYEAAYGKLVRPGYNSAHAFGCTSTYGCYFAQTFNKCPGRLYRVRFYYKWYKSDNITGSFTAQQTYGGDDGELDIESPKVVPAGGTPWQQGTFFLRIPKNVKYFDASHVAWEFDRAHAYVDELSVVSVPPHPQIKSGAKSVIVNGGFETGKLSPWTSESDKKKDVSVVSPGLNSDYALRVHSGATLKQDLATKPNTSYLFSFDLSSLDKDFGAGFGVLFAWNLNKNVYYPRFGKGNYTWAIPFIAYSNITRLSVTVSAGPYKPVYLDNFFLKELQTSLM